MRAAVYSRKWIDFSYAKMSGAMVLHVYFDQQGVDLQYVGKEFPVKSRWTTRADM